MIAIYRKAYDDKHYLIGLAYSNLGGLYLERKNYGSAEGCFREALRRYGDTLPAGHLYFGITRLKLGRALLRAGRAREAASGPRPERGRPSSTPSLARQMAGRIVQRGLP